MAYTGVTIYTGEACKDGIWDRDVVVMSFFMLVSSPYKRLFFYTYNADWNLFREKKEL